ncbi:MAG: RDD family protein [Planctomycetales bacterium]
MGKHLSDAKRQAVSSERRIHDVQVELVTPENIAFNYRVAGPFHRLPAFLIDLVIRALVYSASMWALWCLLLLAGFQAAEFAMMVGLILWFAMDWFYGAGCEAMFNGQTPGKRLMQLRVLSERGGPIETWQAVMRNFLRLADLMPMVGLVAAGANQKFQRLGDLAAGTIVVVEEPQRLYGVVRVEEELALRLAAELPRNFQVSRGLGRALSEYVLRRKALGRGRRDEVASYLGEPLCRMLDLPPDTDYDLILCALYHRAFLSDADEDHYDRALRTSDPTESASQEVVFIR